MPPGGRTKRMTNSTLSCRIELPDAFRRDDFLDFHRRDALGVAEQVSHDALRKGLVWDRHPACLSIHFHARQALVMLDVDGAVEINLDALQSMARRMLGLTQAIDDFEQHYRGHPLLGALIANHPGLRVPLAATPFEALTWAITGQQISVSAALSVRRKFIQAAGLRHASGLWCYPDAHQLATLNEATLRQAGFSLTKARTLMALAQGIESGQLPLDSWIETTPVDDIRAQLLQVRGIGPWTVNYALLRGFGYLDGSLHGDVAVRRKLKILLGSEKPISESSAQQWLTAFSPWRALVAAHLWAMPASDRGQDL